MRLYLLLTLILFYSHIFSITYEYIHYVGEQASVRTFEIENHEDGYIFKTIFEDFYIESLVDKNLNLKRQIKDNDSLKDELKIEIKDQDIIINKNIISKFNIKTTKPLGHIEYLGEWVKSKDKKLNFFIVAAKYDDKGDPIVGKIEKLDFYLRKIKKEIIRIDGVNIETIKVLYTLKNPFYSMFWKNHYWYRLSDGLLIKYEAVVTPPNREGRSGVLRTLK